VLRREWRRGKYGTTLLRGVTGSGKPKSILEAVAAALKSGRQALVLVLPEIALTEQFLATALQARFGAKPAECIRERDNDTQRRRIWKMGGRAKLQVIYRRAIGACFAVSEPWP